MMKRQFRQIEDIRVDGYPAREYQEKTAAGEEPGAAPAQLQDTLSLPIPNQSTAALKASLTVKARQIAEIPYPQSERETPVELSQLIAGQNGNARYSPRLLQMLPFPVRLPIVKLLARAQDPGPEEYSTIRPKPRGRSALGWLPSLALTQALGMLLVAYAFTKSRDGGADVNTFFIPGVLLIFIPTVVRLIFPGASRAERIGLVCIVGIYCYLIKVMSSPLYFSFFDEFLHWRTVNDIASSGHLFNENALLPVSPYYPGLEIVTNALSALSGLSTFNAGLIVIGVARLLMILALFALYEQLVRSSRVASLATIIYMANPHFLLFDSQYGYESLALPLATLVLFAMAPHQVVSVRLKRLKPMSPFMVFTKEGRKRLSDDLRWITLTAWIAFSAVIFTHHVTDFFLVGLLVVWAVTYGFMRLTPLYQSNLLKTALFGAIFTALWLFFRGNPVVEYLSSFIGESLQELKGVLTGSGSARQLFVTYAGQPTPLWERAVTLSSVALVTFALPFGLLCLWLRYRANALACLFGLLSLLYPVSQVFRFTTTGSELADRAAAFLFIPIALVLAIFIVQFWPTRSLNWKNASFLTSAISLVILGGIILGAGPSSALLPGPYQVIADARSIEPEGIQAALWADSRLGANNRMAADRINQILMGTYGDQRIVSSIEDKIDISPVFLSTRLGPNEMAILRQAGIHYLVVDLRLTRSLPLLGYYYEQSEVDAFQRTAPIDLGALTKFNTIPQINRVFDSGDIVIYDTGGLIDAPETP